jgi:hypothetical protein
MIGPKVYYPKLAVVLNFDTNSECWSQFVKPYHSVVSCALNIEDLASKNFCKFSKK